MFISWKRNSYVKVAVSSTLVLAFAGASFTVISNNSNNIENDAGFASRRTFPVVEVQKHNHSEDCWIAINGEVFNVTNFLQVHPGGKERLMKYAGKDASIEFGQMHSKEVLAKMSNFIEHMGSLEGEFEEELTPEMLQIRENLQNKPPIQAIFNLTDFEFVAKHILPQTTYIYFCTGASDEFSMRHNHYAYGRVFFRPKVLQEIGPPDLSTTFLGDEVQMPLYITAFAGSKFAHPLGERILQRAAYDNGIMQMIPKLLSYPLEEFFEEVPDDQKHWFQLHFDSQEELDNVEKTIKRMEATGNMRGLFVNVDLADLGNRERDSKKRVEDQDAADQLSVIANNGRVKYPRRFCWKEIKRIQEATDVPICLKGVQRGEDVVLAAQNGIKACILSNHGGRQLDFSRPPLEVLVEARRMLKEKGLENNIELYVDGGLRRGSDIVKALCLGAKGVGMGRPFLYAMSGYGEEGVNKLFEILRVEMVNNMKLLGVDKISDLNEDLVDASNLSIRHYGVTDGLYDQAYERLLYPEYKNLKQLGK
ncbi:FMN-dependent alpha-hydroxy acid dehydrogenase family protein CYBJADRAFT_153096 [Cyberlindnera jadinii NRRL Y-1542]|nr:hypothetical protein CYBJADRAFT_153096 [Cyberlindnera jadinii NRRL Y-1542]ODV72264.1 hypothetical protein CYBJADRAFT_153096 [Cyberlindnera jadinii NRRL Y-1542]